MCAQAHRPRPHAARTFNETPRGRNHRDDRLRSKHSYAVSVEPQAALASLHDDIAAIKSRIAKTEQDRDVWKMSGLHEKYLEAYFLVEALELQLDERLRKLRTSRASSE